VTGYLVELYVSRFAAGELTLAAKRVRESAERLTRAGTVVHFVRTIFVPEDETCFYLLEADSTEAVERAVTAAELPYERIVEAVTEPSESSVRRRSP
jgi:hypothetical protein